MRMATIPTVANGPRKATASAKPPTTRAIANAAYTSHNITARMIRRATVSMVSRSCLQAKVYKATDCLWPRQLGFFLLLDPSVYRGGLGGEYAQMHGLCAC